MASKFNEGDSVFFPFIDGKVELDSQLRPRMYKTVDQFNAKFPSFRRGEAKLVEYIPANKSFSSDFRGALLNCAVRYALGRASYMPSLVMDEISPMIAYLSPKTLWCLDRDISEWLEQYPNGKYRDEWGKFLSKIQTQIKINKEANTE